MHDTISWYLVQARLADLRQHEQRDRVARIARRARRGHAVLKHRTVHTSLVSEPSVTIELD